MDHDRIRQDFPLVSDLIYLDNAATSLSPMAVIEAMNEYDLLYRANVGRGVHRLSQIATQLYWDAHETLNSFVGGKDGIPVLVKNCTEAINTVAYGLSFSPGDRIVTTITEHHSNLLPWMALRDCGVSLEIVKPSNGMTVSADDISEAVDSDTKLVTVSQASNVLGSTLPVREISDIAHDAGALCLVDGSQSVPHMDVDVSRIGCDFLCFSGHKMLGPTGTGVLWMREECLEPWALGGGMIQEVTEEGFIPEHGYARYEAGTPHVSGALGLRAAVRYLQDIGMEEIRSHEETLTGKLIDGLSGINDVKIIGPPAGKERIGVVSFNLEGFHPHEVAHILDDEYGIIVRSGHHCCMPLMQYLEIPDGTVRASLYLYNTEDEVKTLIGAMEDLAEGT